MKRTVFVTGGTGFIGVSVIAQLIQRGYSVTALVRSGSEQKVPAGCNVLVGNALDAATFSCKGAETFIELVGTPHPAPWRGEQFRTVDFPAIQAGVMAAVRDGVSYFIYVSVAQPAPVMHEYIEVRKGGERLIAASGLRATILRPWYVLGPGRFWPVILKPFYLFAEQLPATRDAARRLGLVTREQMVAALVWAVENVPDGRRILEVPDIQRAK